MAEVAYRAKIAPVREEAERTAAAFLAAREREDDPEAVRVLSDQSAALLFELRRELIL